MYRFYKRGHKYRYTMSDKYYRELEGKRSREEMYFVDNAHYNFKITDIEEQQSFFVDCLNRIREEPRYYIENINKLCKIKLNLTLFK